MGAVTVEASGAGSSVGSGVGLAVPVAVGVGVGVWVGAGVWVEVGDGDGLGGFDGLGRFDGLGGFDGLGVGGDPVSGAWTAVPSRDSMMFANAPGAKDPNVRSAANVDARLSE